MSRKWVEVAAGVIRAPDGRILLGQRAEGTFYPGYWEFPGGKVEAGESPAAALVRELDEELGLKVERLHPWLIREFEYEHACVRLHFFTVNRWQGEPQAIVHAALAWQDPLQPEVAPMLPANDPILKALRLPQRMGVTQLSANSPAAHLLAVQAAVRRGLGLIQVRAPQWSLAERHAWLKTLRQAVDEAAAAAAQPRPLVLLNQNGEDPLPDEADGVHLSAQALRRLRERPAVEWLGASCHSCAELQLALEWQLDYVVVGSVCATPSHPGQAGLGWTGFAELVKNLPMPVFAIGGLTWADEVQAWQAGAHGIAAIRAAWAAD